MGRVWILVGLLALGGAACGDDEDDAAAEPVTEESYLEEAQRLCDQHGPKFAEAYAETRQDSDAEEVALYRSDFIPRGRALVRSLAEHGFPPDKDAEYREALNAGLDALTELESDPYGFIDDRQAGRVPPEENPVYRFRDALATAQIPC